MRPSLARRGLLPSLALAAVVALGGCAPTVPCRNYTQLFFGLAIGDGQGEVSEPLFQAFLAEVVTPRFPDGFTVIDAIGQYRQQSTQTIIREKSRIILLVHPDDGTTDAAIAAIVADYKQRFHQEAVLRLDGCAAATF
ncbi:MAG: DUF3574 domain-containing protein [Proteobacteria bacterium]|nr:DUF3574 domain-containing protein [Pseudomonadota bacterium]